jgi:hypothetical protein
VAKLEGWVAYLKGWVAMFVDGWLSRGLGGYVRGMGG